MKRQSNDSISKNLTDSDLESMIFKIIQNMKNSNFRQKNFLLQKKVFEV